MHYIGGWSISGVIKDCTYVEYLEAHGCTTLTTGIKSSVDIQIMLLSWSIQSTVINNFITSHHCNILKKEGNWKRHKIKFDTLKLF